MVLENHDGSCDCSTKKKIVVAGVFGFSKEQMFLCRLILLPDNVSEVTRNNYHSHPDTAQSIFILGFR